MAKYGLFLKNGVECISIYNTTHESLRYKLDGYYLAKKYFTGIKQLSEENFDKLFDVQKL